MAKRQNYGFDKRRKELDRKAKKDAKATERRNRRDAQSPQEIVDSPSPEGAPPPAPLIPGDESKPTGTTGSAD